MRKRTRLAVGVAAVAVGLALTLRPDILSFDLATAFTVVVWALALAGAGLAVYARLDGDGADDGPLPRASERPAYDVPGDDLAATVADLGAGERDAADRDRVRARVRSTVVDALARFEAESSVAARERVAADTWTDDDEAAALFGDEGADAPRRDGVETDFDGRVERAADAAAREIADIDGSGAAVDSATDSSGAESDD